MGGAAQDGLPFRDFPGQGHADDQPVGRQAGAFPSRQADAELFRQAPHARINAFHLGDGAVRVNQQGDQRMARHAPHGSDVRYGARQSLPADQFRFRAGEEVHAFHHAVGLQEQVRSPGASGYGAVVSGSGDQPVVDGHQGKKAAYERVFPHLADGGIMSHKAAAGRGRGC